MRTMFRALVAAAALIAIGLTNVAPASAATGDTYARYASPNTYARIKWSEGLSIHTVGTKLFSASCSAQCGAGGWGEMVMASGDVFRLYVSSGKSGSHSFYSPADRFRFCANGIDGKPGKCTGWVYN